MNSKKDIQRYKNFFDRVEKKYKISFHILPATKIFSYTQKQSEKFFLVLGSIILYKFFRKDSIK